MAAELGQKGIDKKMMMHVVVAMVHIIVMMCVVYLPLAFLVYK